MTVAPLLLSTTVDVPEAAVQSTKLRFIPTDYKYVTHTKISFFVLPFARRGVKRRHKRRHTYLHATYRFYMAGAFFMSFYGLAGLVRFAIIL
jgi:hypothetical protein